MTYQFCTKPTIYGTTKKFFPLHKNRTKGNHTRKISFGVHRNYTSWSPVSQDFGSINFSVFRGHARHRERGFGALAQSLGRTAIPLLKMFSPSCKKCRSRFIGN